MTDAVDELFVGALDEFVKRRDELVKQLKKDGDKETAAEVKALRKPSAAAWAINQVARRSHDAIDALVVAARGVHEAQARAVQGKDGGGLRGATEEWRKCINALAAEVAKEAGAQYRDAAAGTFEAASTSDEWTQIVKAGRLMATLEPGGFGLQDMPDPVLTRPAKAATPSPPVEEEPRDDKAIAEARARLEKATHRLRRAEQRLDQARAAVDEAARAHDEAADELRELEG
jgi:hypothetical protein